LIDRSSRVTLTDNGVFDPRPDARDAVEISATAAPAADGGLISVHTAIHHWSTWTKGCYRRALAGVSRGAIGTRREEKSTGWPVDDGDAELLRRCQQGDETALDALVRSYQQRIFHSAPAAGNREPPGPPSEPKSSVPKRSTP
jgi:hypothetical protein